MKIEIKHRFNASVLFAHDCENNSLVITLAMALQAGADLGEFKLVGARPVVQLGPIGSRNDYMLAFVTDKGLRIKAGCFDGSVEEFEDAVEETHTGGNHLAEYKAAIAYLKIHADLWEEE